MTDDTGDTARARILAEFRALPIDHQTSAYKDITAAFAASRETRRQQLDAEIRVLGFMPGEGRKKVPERKKPA